jgi:hypothetical protein
LSLFEHPGSELLAAKIAAASNMHDALNIGAKPRVTSANFITADVARNSGCPPTGENVALCVMLKTSPVTRIDQHERLPAISRTQVVRRGDTGYAGTDNSDFVELVRTCGYSSTPVR